MAAAALAWWADRSSKMVDSVKSGISPGRTKTAFPLVSMPARPARNASPVPI